MNLNLKINNIILYLFYTNFRETNYQFIIFSEITQLYYLFIKFYFIICILKQYYFI